MICTKCGSEMPDDAAECGVCGEKFPGQDEACELPLITTEDKLIEYPENACEPPPEIRPEPAGERDRAEKDKAKALRRGGIFWDAAALVLVLCACAAAFYPLCRDFADICVEISEAVGQGDVFPVEGMVFAAALITAAFAADFALALRNILNRGTKRVFFFFAFPVLFAFWLFARINDTPARFVGSSRTAQAILCGSRMFYKDDFTLISLVILAFSLCVQIAARKAGAGKAEK